MLPDGFPRDTPPGARWSELASKKLAELEAMSRRIEAMRAALQAFPAAAAATSIDAEAIAAKRCM